MNENTAIATGYVHKIFDTIEVSPTFKKREVVIQTGEDGEDFRQFLKIEFTQTKTELLNTYKEGDKLQININLNGRIWTPKEGEPKYFNTLQGWKIELLNVGTDPISNPETKDVPPADSFAEDLPF